MKGSPHSLTSTILPFLSLSLSPSQHLTRSHLPHVFRVVMELGCVCSVRPKERAHDLSVPWNLGQLKKESPKEVCTLLTSPY